MSVLAFCIFKPQRVGPLVTAHLAKRSCSFLGLKKDLANSMVFRNGPHQVFSVPKRTIIKKRELIGANITVHMKPEYKKDKIDPEFEFVYCSENVRLYIWWTPLAIILTATIFILSGKIIVDDIWKGKELENIAIDQLGLDPLNPLQAASVLMPVALSMLVAVLYYFRGILLRLYYNPSTNEFIAVLLKYGTYRQKVYFKPSDVVNLEKIKMRGNILIKGIPVRVSESSFNDIAVYNILMGHSVSRPRQNKLQDKESIMKTLEEVKNKMEKKQTDDFLERYKEKRKLKQRKNR